MLWSSKTVAEVQDVADVVEDMLAGQEVTVSPVVVTHDGSVREYLVLRGDASPRMVAKMVVYDQADTLPMAVRLMLSDGVPLVITRTAGGFVTSSWN